MAMVVVVTVLLTYLTADGYAETKHSCHKYWVDKNVKLNLSSGNLNTLHSISALYDIY